MAALKGTADSTETRDAPCEVVPGLYISSALAAEQSLSYVVGSKDKGRFTAVVSIGCPTPQLPAGAGSTLALLELPVPKDLPETILLDSLAQTTRFIGKNLHGGGCVLVHCVYGQSRSAAAVLAYLLALPGLADGDTAWRHTLPEALALLTLARPVICINPGFLAQLFLLAQLGPTGRGSAAAVRLLQQTERRLRGEPPVHAAHGILPAPAVGGVRCEVCRQQLCGEEDAVRAEDGQLAEFVQRFTDGFWTGYPPSFAAQNKKKKGKAKAKGGIPLHVAKAAVSGRTEVLCCWLPWMAGQASSDALAPLCCPKCSTELIPKTPNGKKNAQKLLNDLETHKENDSMPPDVKFNTVIPKLPQTAPRELIGSYTPKFKEHMLSADVRARADNFRLGVLVATGAA